MSTVTDSLPPALDNISLPPLPEQPSLNRDLYNFEYLNSTFFFSTRADEDRDEEEKYYMSILEENQTSSQPLPMKQTQQSCTHRQMPSATIPDLVSSSYQSIRMFTHSSSLAEDDDDDYDDYDSSLSDSEDELPEDYNGVFGDDIVEHTALKLDRSSFENRAELLKTQFLDPLRTGSRRPLSSIFF